MEAASLLLASALLCCIAANSNIILGNNPHPLPYRTAPYRTSTFVTFHSIGAESLLPTDCACAITLSYLSQHISTSDKTLPSLYNT